MKKQSIRVLALAAVAGTTVSSCTLLKDLEYEVTPCPLEMHGDSVQVTVDITFPEKSLNKKASAEITPMLGETALKPVTFQGEKATGNGNVIQYKPGGKYTYTDVVAYKPAFENTELMITGTVSKKGTVKDEIDPIEICKGTIVTPLLVNKSGQVRLADDKFERVTPETEFAQINYLKGKSNVRTSELREDDIKETEAWLASAETNPKIDIKSIKVTGYASPEGEEDKNGTLSSDRATTGKETMMKLADKAKNTKASDEGIYSTVGSGEDYPGFKKALKADTQMNEDDKNLVIRVIEMNASSAQREEELRNMRATFTYLDKNIFPLLRRSEIVTNYDLTGFSDEELKNYSVSNPDTLNLEELLFTATLYEDLNEKLRIYKIAEGRYAEDYRPSNNVGAVLYMQNKVSEAKAKFEKANGIKDNEISKNNLGAVAIVEGDREKAWSLLNQAGSSSETSYNKGVLNIQDGDYDDAVSNLGSEATFNKALAQLLNGNPSAAVSTIDNSVDAETAQGYYLKAIAAARQDQLNELVNNLKSAIAKDGSYKAKAMKDREFLKYAENAAFTAIVK
ncbi:MAG: hypothetical protein HWE22_12845 [Flavobacteriales bacterium]|nr:hypothetical protein [Flavobacteriales bacterium]